MFRGIIDRLKRLYYKAFVLLVYGPCVLDDLEGRSRPVHSTESDKSFEV